MPPIVAPKKTIKECPSLSLRYYKWPAPAYYPRCLREPASSLLPGLFKSWVPLYIALSSIPISHHENVQV
ncbi:hypothetical protein L596_021063 [Steinernema carpocapsae]|uniref:Uncharacterized protein n=1 Tax=Steinernema carpocapsae TaxID=34508 RepID=A0A4U5MW41_STECR|nr:hypothetical protein L596_021063 [Steinernema carpocapsae]